MLMKMISSTTCSVLTIKGRVHTTMKTIKISLVVLLLALVITPLTGALYSPDKDGYALAGQQFIGTSVRVQGMGGAGYGVKGYHDSFLFNPANLAGSGFKLSLPSITVTAHNVQSILASGAIDEFVDGGDDGMIQGAMDLLGTIKKGYGDFLTTDISTTFTLGGFGLSIQAQERLMTYNKKGTTSQSKLIAQLTAAVTLGYGLNIKAVPNILDIDVGVSVQAVYKAYSKTIGAVDLIDKIDDDFDDFDAGKFFLAELPMAAGWGVPISIGANLNFPYGLSFSVVAGNINGNYKMATYASLTDWNEVLFGDGSSDDSTAVLDKEWDLEVPWTLGFGFTWAPTFLGNIIKPTIAIDVVDVMAMGGKQADELTQSFLEQTRLGASVRLLSMFDVRYGLNQGYQSLGVGFDLLVFHIDAAYYTREYGKDIGDKPIDALSLRFSIGSR